MELKKQKIEGFVLKRFIISKKITTSFQKIYSPKLAARAYQGTKQFFLKILVGK